MNKYTVAISDGYYVIRKTENGVLANTMLLSMRDDRPALIRAELNDLALKAKVHWKYATDVDWDCDICTVQTRPGPTIAYKGWSLSCVDEKIANEICDEMNALVGMCNKVEHVPLYDTVKIVDGAEQPPEPPPPDFICLPPCKNCDGSGYKPSMRIVCGCMSMEQREGIRTFHFTEAEVKFLKDAIEAADNDGFYLENDDPIKRSVCKKLGMKLSWKGETVT